MFGIDKPQRGCLQASAESVSLPTEKPHPEAPLSGITGRSEPRSRSFLENNQLALSSLGAPSPLYGSMHPLAVLRYPSAFIYGYYVARKLLFFFLTLHSPWQPEKNLFFFIPPPGSICLLFLFFVSPNCVCVWGGERETTCIFWRCHLIHEVSYLSSSGCCLDPTNYQLPWCITP